MRQDDTPELDLLTSKEVAQMLRVPVATVYYWRERGSGPKGAQVGRQVLYNRQDVEDWWRLRVQRDGRSRP